MDTIAAIGDRHELRIFDYNRLAEPQFDRIEVVIDLDSNISAELMHVAARAGVKFIQAQTNGLDLVEVATIHRAGITLAHCPGHLSSKALAVITL